MLYYLTNRIYWKYDMSVMNIDNFKLYDNGNIVVVKQTHVIPNQTLKLSSFSALFERYSTTDLYIYIEHIDRIIVDISLNFDVYSHNHFIIGHVKTLYMNDLELEYQNIFDLVHTGKIYSKHYKNKNYKDCLNYMKMLRL